MASTRAVYDNYLQAKSRLPLLAKIMMEDILPPHAHTWHIRNALAFKAAILYLKKDRVVITGPTDEKTLHRLIISQARLHENMYRTGGNAAKRYTFTTAKPHPQYNAQPQSNATLDKYGPNGSYLMNNLPAPVDAILDMHLSLIHI